MKALPFTLVLLGSITGLASADVDQLASVLGDQLQQAWYQDRDSHAWLLSDGVGDGIASPPCAKTLAALRAAGAPADRTIELREDSRDLRRGRHPLPAARRACDAIERQARIKRFERVAQLAVDKIGGSDTFAQCIALYDGLIASGIPATEQVPATKLMTQRGMIEWSGSIEALRVAHCDGALAKAKTDLEAKQAPYKKLLRAAKLELAGNGRQYTLIGGETTNDPAKLAAAAVWFDALSDLTGNETCPQGVKRKTLRRYQFAADHTLVRQTARDFCGDIPPAELR